MSIDTGTRDLGEIAPRAALAAVSSGFVDLSYKTQQLTNLPEIEEAERVGALARWEDLLAADPTGTLFQGPVWCLEWYRAYHERYQPRMLVVMCGDSLVGLVPLAVERATGKLVFACGIMSDYRDVLALPQHKQTVVSELLQFYCAGKFPDPLRLGPMLPESNTVGLARTACNGVAKAYAISRTHPGWRWWPIDNSAAEFVKKKSVRQAIKYYQGQGAVRLERIETVEAWHEFKHEFFDQHSLRQVYAGRPASFNDSMKQTFYEALIRNNPDTVHVVALRVADRIIAAHYGPIRDGVLYWGAPSFDIREFKRSPGLVLLALIMQDAERLGLRGIDLTIGVEEYKRRFSNSHAELPTVEIYGGRLPYYAQVLRDTAVTVAKMLVAKLRGPQGWDRTKAYLGKMAEQAQRLPELGVKNSLVRITRRGANAIGERAKWLTLIATPADLQPAEPVLGAGESCSFNTDELRDLLRWRGPSLETAREISARVQRAPEDLRKGRTLHTVLVNGRLACWGWSYWPQGPERIDVTQTELAFEPNSVSLYDFYTIPEFRGRRLYQALLTHILLTRFAEHAERAYIMVQDTNVSSCKAIERVGFHLVMVDEINRVFGWKKLRHTKPNGTEGD